MRNLNAYCRGLEYDGMKKEYLRLLRMIYNSKKFKIWENSFSLAVIYIITSTIYTSNIFNLASIFDNHKKKVLNHIILIDYKDQKGIIGAKILFTNTKGQHLCTWINTWIKRENVIYETGSEHAPFP